MPVNARSPYSHLVAQLARTDWKEWFRKARAENDTHDWRWLINYWVGPNSYRAFRNQPEPPSKVFRTWAYDALFGKNAGFERLLAVRSRAEYEDWLDAHVRSLRRRWAARMNAQMPFGPSRKFLNLIMKGICANHGLKEADFKRLVWWLHVPLDKFSILWVKDYVAASPFAQCIGRIPQNVRMGFVKSEIMYRAFQECMRELAEQAGVPPITIDIVAWDEAHAASSKKIHAQRK